MPSIAAVAVIAVVVTMLVKLAACGENFFLQGTDVMELLGMCTIVGVGIKLEGSIARCRRAEVGRANSDNSEKKRSTHVLDERRNPSTPFVRALRPVSDARVDPARLISMAANPKDCEVHGVSRSALLILTGGNYDSCELHWPMEVAAWAAELGFVAHVLRYRVRGDGYFWPAANEDCMMALEMLKAENFNQKIGVLGFSAGGHLASFVAATATETLRPDFQILLYPCTNTETPARDPWKARLGYPGREANTFDMVTSSTPPCFIAVSTEDEISSYEENVKPYVEACRLNNVSCSVVHASMGSHGHGWHDAWTPKCEEWLAANGLTTIGIAGGNM